MARRGMPSTERDLASFPSSIAAITTFSPMIAAAGLCSSAERPRICTLGDLFHFRFGGTAFIAGSNDIRRMESVRTPTKPENSADRLVARRMKRPSSRQQSAQTQQQKPRLLQANTPQDFPGFVARVVAERLNRRRIQQINQPAIIGLLKIMQ